MHQHRIILVNPDDRVWRRTRFSRPVRRAAGKAHAQQSCQRGFVQRIWDRRRKSGSRTVPAGPGRREGQRRPAVRQRPRVQRDRQPQEGPAALGDQAGSTAYRTGTRSTTRPQKSESSSKTTRGSIAPPTQARVPAWILTNYRFFDWRVYLLVRFIRIEVLVSWVPFAETLDPSRRGCKFQLAS